MNLWAQSKIKIYLKKEATVHIATDSKSYISEILQCIYKVRNDFLWINDINYYLNVDILDIIILLNIILDDNN